MPEETCVPLNLDMDSCSPKRLCCNEGGVQAYNQFGACPSNQGYTVNSEECACCRPPCTPRDYRVTFTIYRMEVNYTRCTLLGEECAYAPAVVPGSQQTHTYAVNNPTPTVDIKESGLNDAGSCGCYFSANFDGWYRLRWDVGCPHEFDVGYSQIDWQGNTRLGDDWSVETTFYHTIDLVERYVSTGINQGYWEPVG